MQDEFEDWMDRKARDLRGEWFDGKVAGISRSNEDGSSRQQNARTLNPYDELQLVPEPHNPYDRNAIALLTPEGNQVGYLEARLAAELTRRMAQGNGARCFVRAVRQRGDTCGVSFGLLYYKS